MILLTVEMARKWFVDFSFDREENWMDLSEFSDEIKFVSVFIMSLWFLILDVSIGCKICRNYNQRQIYYASLVGKRKYPKLL